MELDKIPVHVLRDVRERGFSDERIATMSAAQLFDEYLHWQGIIGFGYEFYRTALELDAAERG